MQLDRQTFIENYFLDFVQGLNLPLNKNTFLQTHKDVFVSMFYDQMLSRVLDYTARDLKKNNQAYYTISSAGHESNVVLGELLQKEDLCFLHYRSGALMARRYRLDLTRDYTEDVLLSFLAAKDDPVSGGRHKAWGSKALNVPPQTSTIASHLPKAVGAAFGIGKLKTTTCLEGVSQKSIVCCSFGDASVNHSTALGAINTAKWTAYQNLPMPILFVCEDNGIGISVKTPQSWIEQNFNTSKQLKYFFADGQDMLQCYQQTQAAIDYCRQYRKPVFLHLQTTRLMGHAGSDIQAVYLSQNEILQQESKDPLLAWVKTLLENQLLSKEDVLIKYRQIKDEVALKLIGCMGAAQLSSAEEIEKPLNTGLRTISTSIRHQSDGQQGKRSWIWNEKLPEDEKPRQMAMLISWALKDLMHDDPSVLVFGEDVAKKGGVYHVTKGLYECFGASRVFNTILDEQSILGLAIGMAHLGFFPIPEIQYLAYYHNAEDQIRSEAASLSFFSNGQFHNPMLIRIASFAYQKGFGGHFHNDNSIAAIRDVPGVIIAVPSRGDDAVTMLRACYALAKDCGKVVFFLEPIALYMRKDLYVDKDGQWSFSYPKKHEKTQYGLCRYYGGQAKVVIVTYANGVYMSLRAVRQFKAQTGMDVDVIDLRWLMPLPIDDLRKHLQNKEGVLIVDECRKSGGIADALSAMILKERKDIAMDCITAHDTYIPLGPAAELVLPSEKDILLKLKSFFK